MLRAQALRGGAVLDMSNQISRITEPTSPVLPLAVVAGLGALLLYVIVQVPRRWSAPTQVGTLIGALVASAGLMVWAWMIDVSRLGETGPFSIGVEGWVDYGGSSEALYLIAVLLVVALVRAMIKAREAQGDEQPPAQAMTGSG